MSKKNIIILAVVIVIFLTGVIYYYTTTNDNKNLSDEQIKEQAVVSINKTIEDYNDGSDFTFIEQSESKVLDPYIITAKPGEDDSYALTYEFPDSGELISFSSTGSEISNVDLSKQNIGITEQNLIDAAITQDYIDKQISEISQKCSSAFTVEGGQQIPVGDNFIISSSFTFDYQDGIYYANNENENTGLYSCSITDNNITYVQKLESKTTLTLN